MPQPLRTEKMFLNYYPYRSVEYTDGVKGDEGGVSLLRNGKDKDLTTLIYKYTSHGLSHGHFDKLNYNLYDKGNEILTDYGLFVLLEWNKNMEAVICPRTKRYASQTIAHNTIVVDEKSHFDGKEAEAEKFHPEKLFSSISNPAVQVVAAKEENAYQGCKASTDGVSAPITRGKEITGQIFFNAYSNDEHQYDLPFHYNGHLISTSFKYNPYTNKLETLGERMVTNFYGKKRKQRWQIQLCNSLF